MYVQVLPKARLCMFRCVLLEARLCTIGAQKNTFHCVLVVRTFIF